MSIVEPIEIKKDFASLELRLTYAECDPSGVVYYGSWFPWMERALSGWMVDHDFPSHRLVPLYGFSTVTRHAECSYLYPAELFDWVRVTMISATLGHRSIRWGFEFVRINDSKRVAEGVLTVVTIDSEGVSTPLPDVFREGILQA